MKTTQLLARQCLSLLSSVWFLSNLLIWLSALLMLTPFKLVPHKGFQTRCVDPLAEHIYRAAVVTNSFWMKRVVGISLEIYGDEAHEGLHVLRSQPWCGGGYALR